MSTTQFSILDTAKFRHAVLDAIAGISIGDVVADLTQLINGTAGPDGNGNFVYLTALEDGTANAVALKVYADSHELYTYDPIVSPKLNTTLSYVSSDSINIPLLAVNPTGGVAKTLQVDSSNNLKVTLGSQTSNVNQIPVATQGYNGFFARVSTASNNLTLVKGSSCNVGAMTFHNTLASGHRYLKIFNAASTGAVTMGTTSAVLNIGVPPNQTITWAPSAGLLFNNGLVIAMTAGASLTDNTSVGAGDVEVTLAYV
jgi:hypothetical protein